MATEISILTWCDPCLAKGEHEEGHPVQVALQGNQPRVMDLCKYHHDEILGALESTLPLYGRRPDGAPKVGRPRKPATQPAVGARMTAEQTQALQRGGGFPCLFCDHHTSTGSAMGAHLKRMHDFSVAEAYGTQCPICGREGTAGTHIGRSHPEAQGQGMVGAFAWAAAHGDPHGVVARQTALAGS